MQIKTFALTDIGLKRKNNQDAYLCDEEHKLFAVADGMGGHRGGEVASQLAVQVLQQFCRENTSLNGPDILAKGINAACEQIFEKSQKNEELTGMGTTVAALLFHKQSLYIGQVGDSRVYLFRDAQVWQLTEDHSLLNEEIRAGRVQADQASEYQFRNVITRSVGYENKVLVDVYTRKVQVGDVFLACSDGLSSHVDGGEMARALQQHGLEMGLKSLISLANARGGDDNITAIVCKVESLT